VLYKMAYGTDEVEHGHGAQPEGKAQSGAATPAGGGHA
jgi:hypothetical protein